jgi:hypothetical protein
MLEDWKGGVCLHFSFFILYPVKYSVTLRKFLTLLNILNHLSVSLQHICYLTGLITFLLFNGVNFPFFHIFTLPFFHYENNQKFLLSNFQFLISNIQFPLSYAF